jgi:rubrerythrin
VDDTLRQYLEQSVATGGQAHIRNLAAAEAAVQRGQFNLAKVLRAVAHAQSIRAREAARLLTADLDPDDLLTEILRELSSNGAGDPDPALAALTARDAVIRAGVAAMVHRAADSLATNSDVLESDVAQFVWACFGCGNLTEGDAPERCAVCGALASEFRVFEPFYSVTPEHLGQRTPEEIVAFLADVPALLANAIAGLDEATLSRKPSPAEWSVKEIVAHIVETDVLFASRVRIILVDEPGKIPSINAVIPPWLLHEGKDYLELSTDATLARLRQVREASLALIRELTPEQWIRWGMNGKEGTTVLDLGTWLANHDQGHLAQIRRQWGRAVEVHGLAAKTGGA